MELKRNRSLYFSESESLCSLEVFVHVNNDPAITKLYDLYRIEMPEYLIATLDEEDLPSDVASNTGERVYAIHW